MDWIEQNYALALGIVFALCIMSAIVGSYFEVDPPEPPANDYPDCDLCGHPTARKDLKDGLCEWCAAKAKMME